MTIAPGGTSLARGLELVEILTAAGVRATVDPRSATPPCVLVTPPERTYDLTCGYTARWKLWALAPGPGNADAWAALDELVDKVRTVLDVERATFASYALAVDSPTVPAYQLDVVEGI